MNLVWKIMLHEVTGGYQVRIDGEGGSAIGKGGTPHLAYQDAAAKLGIKPWLTSKPE